MRYIKLFDVFWTHSLEAFCSTLSEPALCPVLVYRRRKLDGYFYRRHGYFQTVRHYNHPIITIEYSQSTDDFVDFETIDISTIDLQANPSALTDQ